MKLIINADDFGISKAVTDGIIDGIKVGAITSTTIMANCGYADYGIELAKQNNIKCIGLHLNITHGKPLTGGKTICDVDGNFFNKNQIYEECDDICENELYTEFLAQKEFVEKRGIKITHVDRHHSPELNPVVKKGMLKFVRDFNLPMRNLHRLTLQ